MINNRRCFMERKSSEIGTILTTVVAAAILPFGEFEVHPLRFKIARFVSCFRLVPVQVIDRSHLCRRSVGVHLLCGCDVDVHVHAGIGPKLDRVECTSRSFATLVLAFKFEAGSLSRASTHPLVERGDEHVRVELGESGVKSKVNEVVHGFELGEH
jgi:hypothetical protein